MPRRRGKKKHNQPSLMFTESPVNLPCQKPSPVYCADNPPTADVVDIDSNINLTWVSPQFKGITATSGRSRPARRCRQTSGTARQPKGKENPAALNKSYRKINSKLVPLHFLGEPVEEAPSPLSSSDEITAFDEDVGWRHDNQLSMLSNHGDPRTDHLHEEPQETFTDVQLALSFNSPGHDTGKRSNPSTDESDSITASTNGVTQTCNGTECNQLPVTTAASSAKPTQKRSKRHRGKKKMPKRLFGAVNFSDSESSSTDDSAEPACSSDLGNPPVLSTDCSKASLRLQVLRQKLLSIPLTPVNTGRSVVEKVLAYDTPEEDYGLSVRERMLKCARRKKNASKS